MKRQITSGPPGKPRAGAVLCKKGFDLFRRCLRRTLPVAGAATLFCGATACVLLWGAVNWLKVEIPLNRADWIVVLGGESGQRVIGAAEAYHQGIARRVFVSGSGDCRLIARRLNMAGVPDVRYECSSRSTHENALLTRTALEPSHPQKILLVTSWYHTRRALRSFQKAWPDVTFGVRGVYPGTRLSNRFMVYEAGSILAEYVKTVWYMARYGVF